MERICSHCHAQLSLEIEADWCPACGGALLERTGLPKTVSKESAAPQVLDHRGIVLPRRHALGGIITPQ
jgi:Zn-finger nucleic acid-binding protein